MTDLGKKLSAAIDTAIAADRAFAAACNKHGCRTRWDWDGGKDPPETAAAFAVKVAADKAMGEAFEAMRAGGK